MTYIPDMPHFKFFKHKILLQSDVELLMLSGDKYSVTVYQLLKTVHSQHSRLMEEQHGRWYELSFHDFAPEGTSCTCITHYKASMKHTAIHEQKTSSYKSFHRRIYICMYNKLWKCFCTTRVDKLHHWPTDHIIDGSGMPRHFATRDCATAASSSENKWAISASVFDRSMAWLSNSMAFSKHPLQQLHKAAYFVEWMESLDTCD